MTDVATLGISVDSRQVRSASSDLDRFTPAARRAEDATRRMGVASITTSAMFRALARELAPFISAGAFIKFSDAATRVNNSLRVAGLEGDALTRVYDRLYVSAQKNAAPLEALTQLYGRASLVQKELGITTEELLGFTDKVAVALRVSGKSAQESSGALLQLSQALGSGVVRAEEFNSILEGALPIAQAAAAGLKEAGGSVARLRQLVIDGKVSSEAFFRAFEAGSVILDQKVAGAQDTVAFGFQRVQNSIINAVGKFNEASGASNALAGALNGLSGSIDDLADNFDEIISGISTVVGWYEKAKKAVEDFYAAMGIKPLDLNSMLPGAAGHGKTRVSVTGFTPGVGNFIGGRGDWTNPNVNPVSLNDFAPPDGDKDKQTRAERMIERVTEALAHEEAQLGRTAREQEIFNRLQDAGVDITSKIGQEIASAAGRLYDLQFAYETLSDVTHGFFDDLRQGLRDGQDAWTAFGNAVVGVMDRVASKLVDMAADTATDWIFNILKFAISPTPFGFAKGGVFQNGRVTAFAKGGLVTQPTLFPMANGGVGLMGEEDTEAVMPLKRGPDGRLGVESHGGGSTYNIHIDARGAQRGVGEEIERHVQRAIERNNRFVVPGIVHRGKDRSMLETGARVG